MPTTKTPDRTPVASRLLGLSSQLRMTVGTDAVDAHMMEAIRHLITLKPRWSELFDSLTPQLLAFSRGLGLRYDEDDRETTLGLASELELVAACVARPDAGEAIEQEQDADPAVVVVDKARQEVRYGGCTCEDFNSTNGFRVLADMATGALVKARDYDVSRLRKRLEAAGMGKVAEAIVSKGDGQYKLQLPARLV